MNSSNQQPADTLKPCLHTSVDNEWSALTGCAYQEVDAGAAHAFLDLIGLTRVFREPAHRAGLIYDLAATAFPGKEVTRAQY